MIEVLYRHESLENRAVIGAGKGLVIASVVGVAAAAAAVISAYNATMSRLVPTNANTNPGDPRCRCCRDPHDRSDHQTFPAKG